MAARRRCAYKLFGADGRTDRKVQHYIPSASRGIKIGVIFGFFLAPILPYRLNVARCKTSVDFLSYGISIDFLRRRS